MMDFPDQLAWTRIPNPPKGQKGTFAFSLSPRKGETLRKVLQTKAEQDFFATGNAHGRKSYVVKAKVDTDIGTENKRTGTGNGRRLDSRQQI